MKVNVFLPCRKGSQRVPKKNIKKFGNYINGLIEIKLNQLINAKRVEKIYLSTNDEEIIEYAQSLSSDKIIIHKRDESLSSSTTSTDELVGHALDLIPDGEILWTHVTSPFLTAVDYDIIISKYFELLDAGYDSLMTTNLIHGFLWNENGAINYDRDKEKWPRTQTIEPIHEVNSAIFLTNTNIYKKYNDRIGVKPYLYSLDKIKGFDIDWEEDFEFAETLLQSRKNII